MSTKEELALKEILGYNVKILSPDQNPLSHHLVGYGRIIHKKPLLTPLLAALISLFPQQSFSNPTASETELPKITLSITPPEETPQQEPDPSLLAQSIEQESVLWSPNHQIVLQDTLPEEELEWMNRSGFLSPKSKRNLYNRLDKFGKPDGTIKLDAEALWSAYLLNLDYVYSLDSRFTEHLEHLVGVTESLMKLAPSIEAARDSIQHFNLQGGFRENLSLREKINRSILGKEIAPRNDNRGLLGVLFYPIRRITGSDLELPDDFGRIRVELDARISNPKIEGVYFTLAEFQRSSWILTFEFGLFIEEVTSLMRDRDIAYGEGIIPTRNIWNGYDNH